MTARVAEAGWYNSISKYFGFIFITLSPTTAVPSPFSAGAVWHLGPWGAAAQGHAGVAAQAVGRDEGPGQTLECDDTQLLSAEFKRPGWASLPLGYHTYTAFLVPFTCPLSAPASGCLLPGTPGSLCSSCADGEEHSFQARMPDNKNNPAGKDVCIFTLSPFPIKSHCNKGGNNAIH